MSYDASGRRTRRPALCVAAAVVLGFHTLVACSNAPNQDEYGTIAAPIVDGQCTIIEVFESGEFQMRYLDYGPASGNVMTRPLEPSDRQIWCFRDYGSWGYTIQHRNLDGLYLDAHENSNGYRAFVNASQHSGNVPHASQLWKVSGPTNDRKLQQLSTGRYLTALATLVVTEPLGESQSWGFSVEMPPSCAPPHSGDDCTFDEPPPP